MLNLPAEVSMSVVMFAPLFTPLVRSHAHVLLVGAVLASRETHRDGDLVSDGAALQSSPPELSPDLEPRSLVESSYQPENEPEIIIEPQAD